MLSLREVKNNIQKYVDAECVKYVKSVLDELNGEALYTHQALQRQVQRFAKDYDMTAKEFMDKYSKMIDKKTINSKNQVVINVEDGLYQSLKNESNVNDFINKCIKFYYDNKDNNYLTEDLFNQKITEVIDLLNNIKVSSMEAINTDKFKKEEKENNIKEEPISSSVSNIEDNNSKAMDEENKTLLKGIMSSWDIN